MNLVSKNNKIATRSNKALSSRLVDATQRWRPTIAENTAIIEFSESVYLPPVARSLKFTVVPGTEDKRWTIDFSDVQESHALQSALHDNSINITYKVLEANLVNLEEDGLLRDTHNMCKAYTNIVLDNCTGSDNLYYASPDSSTEYKNIHISGIVIDADTFGHGIEYNTLYNVQFDNCEIRQYGLQATSLNNCSFNDCLWEDPWNSGFGDIEDCTFINCTLRGSNSGRPLFKGENIFLNCDIHFDDPENQTKDYPNCKFINCKLRSLYSYTYEFAGLYTDSCDCSGLFTTVTYPINFNLWQVYGSASQMHNIAIFPDSHLESDIWKYCSGMLDFYNRCKAVGISDVNGSACFGSSATKPNSGDWLQIPVSWGGLMV